jgi:hypothetical protein
MIIRTQPFWRLREGGESRKLDAVESFICEKCPGTRSGLSFYPLKHLRWSVHFSKGPIWDVPARHRVKAEV